MTTYMLSLISVVVYFFLSQRRVKAATQLVAGFEHTCVFLNDGAVKCWGYGNSGQLGYGDTNNRGDGPTEMGDNLPTVDLGTPTCVPAKYSPKDNLNFMLVLGSMI